MNSIFLGRLIGVTALAASSAFFPFMFLILSFLIGLSSASSVLIGQAYGARDLIKMRAVAGTTLTGCFLLGAVVGAIGGTWAEPLLVAARTPAEILPDAVRYARIIFFSMPAFALFIAYTTFLRGTGDAKTPLLALVVSTLVSLAVTPALILGWLGLPPMGAEAGAVAALVSNLVTMAWLAVHLLRRAHLLAPNSMLLARLRIDWAILQTLVRIGIPTALQVIVISLSEIAVLSFVNAFGAKATAAYGAFNQVASFVQMPAVSMGIAASVFGAQAIGRGDPGRLSGIARTALVTNFAICAVTISVVYLFSRSILGFFIDDPETADMAERLLRITLWSYVIFGTSSVLAGIMRSSGAVLWPTVFSFFSIWGVEVPVAYILSKRIGIDGVWLGYPAAFVTSLTLLGLYYLLVWRRQEYRRLI
jgi:putative MATE family efflux protein